MVDRWVPPYFGSWDRLVANAIYSAQHPPHPPIPTTHLEDAMRALEHGSAVALQQAPVPDPWRDAVSALVAAVNVQQLATTVEEPLRDKLEKSANASIEQVIDDYCKTPPRKYPWPFPGPPPWIFMIASDLNVIANSGVTTGMREGLLKAAGRVLQQGSQ